MNYKNNLTFSQKAAVEGEVAYVVSTSPHEAELLYRIYCILKDAPENLKEYLLYCFKELAPFDEETYNKLIAELGLKTPPMWLWINRIIGDLKTGLRFSELTIQESSFVNKRELRKYLIKSAFLLFCMKLSIVYYKPILELCNTVIREKDLSFLKESCFYIQNSINTEFDKTELDKKVTDKELKEIFKSSLDLREILSFQVEMGAFSKSSVEESEDDVIVNLVDENGEVKDITEELKNILVGIGLNISSKKEKAEKKKKTKKEKSSFAVVKVFNSSKCSTTLKTFLSKKEAEDFIEEIVSKYPELLNTCSFVIKENQQSKDL